MGVCRNAISGAVLALQALIVVAADLPPAPVGGTDAMWDCWISVDDRQVVSYYVRCIRGRTPVDDAVTDVSVEDGLLDYVHQMIHAGQVLALDQDLANGMGEALAGHIHSVRIHQYPYEQSWATERPQHLVQAILCPATATCPVFIVH